MTRFSVIVDIRDNQSELSSTMDFAIYKFSAQSDSLMPGETVVLPYAAGDNQFAYRPVGIHIAVGPFEQTLYAPAHFTVSFGPGGISVTWGFTTVPVGKVVAFQFEKVPHPKVDGEEVALADLSNATVTDFAKGLLLANTAADLIALGLSPTASPVFTGNPTAPTPAPGDNDTSISTTAFVEAVRVVLASAIALKAGLASPTFTGVVDVTQSMRLSGDLTPAQITANQNNYSPAGFANATVVRLSSDVARSITGLADVADGRILALVNVGASPITLDGTSTASTAANRFAFGGVSTNRVLAPNQAALLIYDITSARWRELASPPVIDLSAYATKVEAIAFAVAMGVAL